MACHRISGRRPLHVSLDMNNSSSGDDAFRYVPSPKKMSIKKFRRRNIISPSKSSSSSGASGSNASKHTSQKIRRKTLESITVLDDSDEEFFDCQNEIPQKLKQTDSVKSFSKLTVHTIPSGSSDEENTSVNNDFVSEVTNCNIDSDDNISTKVDEPHNSCNEKTKSPQSLPADTSVSEFMKTFAVLRDSFKESEEDDLIVVTKVHPDVHVTYRDLKQVVKNIVANISLNKTQSVQSITPQQVAQRMKNLYHKDFTNRLGEIEVCLQKAKLCYTPEKSQSNEIRPGLKSSDLKTLDPGEWLNDVIINKYLGLLVGASSNACMLSSFFLEELRRNVKPNLPEGWHRKKYLLIPLCIDSHWSLLCAMVHDHTVDIYNSMVTSLKEKECASIILTYLQLRYNEQTNQNTQWSLMLSNANFARPITNPESAQNLPQQENAFDCGMYVCMYARLILFHLSPNFQASHATAFRNWIRQELIKDKLIS